MDIKKKQKLLKNLPLFANLPEAKLPTLAKFLEPMTVKEGTVLFEEGSKGDSLFFISSGQIRVQKIVIDKEGNQAAKDLAVLIAGDCFGEMALFDADAVRSAKAVAAQDAVLFRLERKQLRRWLTSNPTLAIGFFNELVQVLTHRLRRSSNELTLLFDLSQWLLTPPPTAKELLEQVLRHLVPHLSGSWSGGAYLYNEFNAEIDLIGSEGDFSQTAAKIKGKSFQTQDPFWIDDRTYIVFFPGEKHLKGYLVFHHAAHLSAEEKNELARTLATSARLIASAVQNVEHREEDAMRARLAATRYVPGV